MTPGNAPERRLRGGDETNGRSVSPEQGLCQPQPPPEVSEAALQEVASLTSNLHLVQNSENQNRLKPLERVEGGARHGPRDRNPDKTRRLRPWLRLRMTESAGRPRRPSCPGGHRWPFSVHVPPSGAGAGAAVPHAGPHRTTRHLSPATGRGSSLAEVFREAEEEERGQNPGEVAEASSEGERAKPAATPACPADTGQLRGKAV